MHLGSSSLHRVMISFIDAWAKTTDGQVSVHLLTHCQIAGAVARVLWKRDHYPWAASLPILGASHDVGKFSAPFLAKCLAWMEAHGVAHLTKRWLRSGCAARHEVFTQSTIADILASRGLPLTPAYILGAHHGIWQMEDSGDLDIAPFLPEERAKLVEYLEAEFGRLLCEPLSDIQARYLAGAVSVADWIASNPDFFPYDDDYSAELRDLLAQRAIDKIGIIPQAFKPDLTFQECFGFLPNAMQQEVDSLPLDRGLYLIEDATGNGKTEAALWLAYRLLTAGKCFPRKRGDVPARGLYFALPTQLSSNLILRRVQKALRKWECFPRKRGDVPRVRLCHSNAWLEQRRYQPMKGSTDALAWFSTSRRGLLAPYGAGTIDQALMSTLKSVRHSAVRTFGIAGKTVVVDECHSYDRYTGSLVEKLAEQCRDLGSPLIVLSATLPTATKQRLRDIFSSPISLDYTTRADTQKHVALVWIDEADIVETAIREAQLGRCVMIVRSTVRLAQATCKAVTAALAGDSMGIGLVHSRFIQRHRRQRERYWTKALGKTGPRPTSAILVGTQILEQSLDIDCDVLLTDLCPIDLIIQRIGRLWRHNRSRSGAPVVHVINPEGDDYGSHGKIYAPYLLARTQETLLGYETLALPEQTRDLIESVYADRTETDFLLQSYKSKLDTSIQAAISRAERAGDDRVDYDDEDTTLTRIIDQPTTDLVIHNGAQQIRGGIRLQFSDRSVDVAKELDGAVGRLLHLNTVKIPWYHIKDAPFESALHRYFPGGVKLARLDADNLDIPNCTYTNTLGFESHAHS